MHVIFLCMPNWVQPCQKNETPPRVSTKSGKVSIGEIQTETSSLHHPFIKWREAQDLQTTLKLHLNLWERPEFHIDICKPRWSKQGCFQMKNTSHSQAGRDSWGEGTHCILLNIWKNLPQDDGDTWLKFPEKPKVIQD